MKPLSEPSAPAPNSREGSAGMDSHLTSLRAEASKNNNGNSGLRMTRSECFLLVFAFKLTAHPLATAAVMVTKCL